MTFLLKAAVSLLVLAATAVFLPVIPLRILSGVLRCVGWVIQKRTRSRREYVRSRVCADEEEFKQAKVSSRVATDDDDWEKVDSSSIGTGSGSSKAPGNGNKWDGIVGFFHPYW